jgi:hypothetical protein
MATTAELQVAYNGADPDSHSMDVDQLAPSLLAIGTLCKRANAIINGEKATVRVLVESDFEHKCFLIHFKVVQDLIVQLQGFLHNEDIKTSKEIIEWLIGVEAMMGGFGLLRYLKEKRGRKPESVVVSDKTGTVEVKFAGDNNKVVINQNVYALSEDKTIISAVKNILRPVLSPDISSVAFMRRGQCVERIDRPQATEIIAMEQPDSLDDTADIKPQVVDARLTIYAPVFDEKSKVWKFIYGDRPISVDISESGISDDVFARGTMRIGDAYLVKLEIAEHKTEKGYRNSYRALAVTKFLPAPHGFQLPLTDDSHGD